MPNDLTGTHQYRLTIEALEQAKHLAAEGAEYWFAREVFPILGYAEWRNFEDVMARGGRSDEGEWDRSVPPFR